jgi:hypothetical protein
MKSRNATTLMEVLVSIFIMGIGLLALLTLFPLGALSMAQAIRDDRINQAALNAQAIGETADVRHDTAIYNPTTSVDLFNNPGTLGIPMPNLAQPGVYDGPSYPVLADPFGAFAPTLSAQQWVTGQAVAGSFAVRRSGISFLPNTATDPSTQSIYRFFTLTDDILFTPDGTPDLSVGLSVKRDADYSWAYLLRRPRASIPSVVEMSIVVYNKRSVSTSPSLNPNEAAFSATFNNAASSVQLTWNATTPAPIIRPNGWILDASLVPNVNNGAAPARPHGYFYRVTDVTTLGPNQVELQVAGNNPFKDFPLGGIGTGVVIVIEGVAEVLEVGTGWLP